MRMRRANFTYYFREESVILEIRRPTTTNLGNTYISFNCYNLQSRKKFKDFKQELSESKRYQYRNIDEVFGLARKYKINTSNAYKPTFINDRIGF